MDTQPQAQVGEAVSPVQWVEPNFLLTADDRQRYSSARRRRDMIPVIPLAALTEVVEGLQADRCEAIDWDAGYLAALDDILAQLEGQTT